MVIEPRILKHAGLPAGIFADKFCFAETGMGAPWHFLNFLPLPQWQGSFRPG
jgi:hypothetical protein